MPDRFATALRMPRLGQRRRTGDTLESIRALLFGAGEQGIYMPDMFYLTTLFQDRAGTTPVTAPGQSVGRFLDRSGLGFHAVANSDAARGIYGIEPFGGRRNLLTYTGFDGAVSGSPGTVPTGWTRFIGTTGGTSTFTAGDGALGGGSLRVTVSNDRHQIGQTINVAANTTYVLSCVADVIAAASFVQILLWVNPPSGSTVSWRVNGGSIITNGLDFPPIGNNQFIEAILTVSSTAGTAIPRFGVGISSNTTGDIVFRNIQVELGSTATAYQRVTTAFDVTEAGVPTVHYVQFDGADDGYLTSTITPGTDKVQVFAGVRKLSDAARGILVESGTGTVETGYFNINAPLALMNHYSFRSAGNPGSAFADALVTSGFAGPITNVLTGLGDIAGDSSILRVNGTQVAQSTADQGTGNYLAYPLFIGRRGGTTLAFNGRIYSLIVRFGPNLTADQIARVERFIAQRTGVTI